jgi:predicted PhzF superfamily epimerase YddE/YHI9
LRKIRSEDGIGMAYVFNLNSPRTAALARFFFPQGTAILEDPATGSATANLGGWCLAMQLTLPVDLQISQGEFVDSPADFRAGQGAPTSHSGTMARRRNAARREKARRSE